MSLSLHRLRHGVVSVRVFAKCILISTQSCDAAVLSSFITEQLKFERHTIMDVESSYQSRYAVIGWHWYENNRTTTLCTTHAFSTCRSQCVSLSLATWANTCSAHMCAFEYIRMRSLTYTSHSQTIPVWYQLILIEYNFDVASFRNSELTECKCQIRFKFSRLICTFGVACAPNHSWSTFVCIFGGESGKR